MARKVARYTVTDEGRDKGKVFEITEMPASAAERWAIRAFTALAKNDIQVPDGAFKAGMAGFAALGLGLLGQLPYESAVVLLDELMGCVRVPAAGITRELVEEDAEEVMTRFKLKLEVLTLHTGFTMPVSGSTPASAG